MTLTLPVCILICISDSMFSWVIKVVPQPPTSPGKLGEEDQTNASTAAVSVCLFKYVCTLSRLSQCKHVFALSILFFRK